MDDQHQPNRPFWDCTACGEPWPCQAAQEYLTAVSGDSLRLAMTMWDYFEQFAIDMGMVPVAGAFRRFIGWAHWLPSKR